MSKNGVLKSGWIMMNETDTRVIDTNALVENKLKELAIKIAEETAEDADFPDGFAEGLNAEQVANLVAEPQQTPEEQTQAQIAEMMEQAQAEIEAMKAQAMDEIEQARAETLESARKEGYEAGLKKGVEEGYAKGHEEGINSVGEEREKLYQEVSEKMEAFQQEYEKKINELEPQFVETLTGIYEHVFQVSLKKSRDLVVHLLQNTMKNIEGNSGYLIHVSKDDYPFVSMQKKEIVKGTSIQLENVDIIEDATLGKSECMIETGNGVFDCSLGTQLESLNEELRLLSYEPKVKEEEQ